MPIPEDRSLSPSSAAGCAKGQPGPSSAAGCAEGQSALPCCVLVCSSVVALLICMKTLSQATVNGDR